ncbi:MAG: hypothetical protein M0R03_14440 [Novosphingobium sp.]|nr:hypothetical protein [Novosphingobium sp.]
MAPIYHKIHHIYPSATIIFVPSFGNEFTREDVVVASSVNEVQDVSSIQLTLTVRNQPGTFSITLMDDKSKFTIHDDPKEEIEKLYNFSQNKRDKRRNNSPIQKVNSNTTTSQVFTRSTTSAVDALKKQQFEIVTKIRDLMLIWQWGPLINYVGNIPRLKLESVKYQQMQLSNDSSLKQHAFTTLLSYISDWENVDVKIKTATSQETNLKQNVGDTVQTNNLPPTTSTTNPADLFYDNTRGNFYEYNNYETWAAFDHYILLDPQTGKKYPTQYVRNPSGNIKERWAFLDDSSIVFVAKTEEEENTFINKFIKEDGLKSTVETFSFTVSPYKGARDTRTFDVLRFNNTDLVEKYRDIDEQGTEEGKFEKGRCKIHPMDRVVIFMTPRFSKEGKFNETPNSELTRVFTGVVNTAQAGYDNGHHIVTVQGEDVTKYMRISIINVNPSLGNLISLSDVTADEKYNIWAQILNGLTTPEIVRMMCLGSGAVSSKSKALNQSIDAIGAYKFSDQDEQPDNIVIEIVNGEEQFKKVGRKGGVATYDFSAILGELFKESSVHIIDPFITDLDGFRPYALQLQTDKSFYQADFKTRREIAYKAAEDSHFNFYADRFGHIWFHPYRFDENWIFSAKIPEVYIIDSPSIISYGFVEDDTNIFTSVHASTESDFTNQFFGDYGFFHGSYRDPIAVLKYGQRIYVASNPIVNINVARDTVISAAGGRTRSRAMDVYAKALLKRLLAEKYQGQVTLAGRPELDPGRPVYIPMRNMIYYVETVDHTLSFGKTFQTTIHLSYGRKPWEFLPELITFSPNDEVYLTDAYLIRD